MELKLKYKNFRLHLEFHNKITVITGDSATGKSTIVHSMFDYTNNIKYKLSDPSFDCMMINDQRRVIDDLSHNRQKMIYMIDEFRIRITKEVIEAIRQCVGCYIIFICRSNISALNYSADALLKLKTDKNGITRGEKYLKNNLPISNPYRSNFDYIITEDAKYGHEWIRRLFIKIDAKFIIAGSILRDGTEIAVSNYDSIKDEIKLQSQNRSDTKYYNKRYSLDDIGGKEKINPTIEGISKINPTAKILVFFDFCSFGSEISHFQSVLENKKMDILFFPHFKSWEFVMLNSNMFKHKWIPYTIFTPDFEESYYEELLQEVSRNNVGTIKHQNQGSLPACFYKICCAYSGKNTGCKYGLSNTSGDKFIDLFLHTSFEVLLKLARRI